MRTNYLIFLILILSLSSLHSADIYYNFDNEEVIGTHPNSFYEFDIIVRSDVSTTKLGDLLLYIFYNTSGFGSNISSSIVVTKATILQGEALGTQLYDISTTNNATNLVAVAVSFNFENSPSAGNDLPDSDTQLMHISIPIVSPSENSGLSFSLTDMIGEQYQSDNSTSYVNVYASDTSETPLPVTLSTFSGVQDGDAVQLNWVTQSESNNWLWNVYRSSTSDLNGSFQHNGMPIWGAGTTSAPTQYSYLDDEIEDLPVVTYYYWLESVDYNGQSELFGPISLNYFQSGEGISAPELKKESLLTSYPNPFNPSTNIAVIVAEDTEADLVIYNSKGQFVDTIFKNKYLEKDSFESFYWDGKSNTGDELPNGVYFAKLAYRNRTKIHRMILLK